MKVEEYWALLNIKMQMFTGKWECIADGLSNFHERLKNKGYSKAYGLFESDESLDQKTNHLPAKNKK